MNTFQMYDPSKKLITMEGKFRSRRLLQHNALSISRSRNLMDLRIEELLPCSTAGNTELSGWPNLFQKNSPPHLAGRLVVNRKEVRLDLETSNGIFFLKSWTIPKSR
jgi:hypothetical protein